MKKLCFEIPFDTGVYVKIAIEKIFPKICRIFLLNIAAYRAAFTECSINITHNRGTDEANKSSSILQHN